MTSISDTSTNLNLVL